MTFLNTITLTPLGWTLLSFFLLQLIAFAKGYISLLGRVKILENDLKDNTVKDSEKESATKHELEALNKKCSSGSALLKTELLSTIRDIKADADKRKDVLFKRVAEVEQKSDIADKKVWERVDLVAQGLVKGETKIEGFEKRLDKLER